MRFSQVISTVGMVSVLALVGCSPQAKTMIPRNTASRSPKEVVQDYYQNIAEANVSGASQFMSPALVAFYHSAADSDFNNVKTLSHVTTDGPYNISLDTSYKYEVQVVASFEAQYDRVAGTMSGPQTRFVYLGRNSRNEPWLIVSIGTGP